MPLNSTCPDILSGVGLPGGQGDQMLIVRSSVHSRL